MSFDQSTAGWNDPTRSGSEVEGGSRRTGLRQRRGTYGVPQRSAEGAPSGPPTTATTDQGSAAELLARYRRARAVATADADPQVLDPATMPPSTGLSWRGRTGTTYLPQLTLPARPRHSGVCWWPARRRRTAATPGRDVAALMSDFGHDLPTRATPQAPPRRQDPFGDTVPVRGRRQAWAGWSPAAAPVAQYQMTSDMAPVAWPFTAGRVLPPYGVPIGLDSFGARFYAGIRQWVLDPDIPVTNTNVIVQGAPGQGKSSGVKCLALRSIPFGDRILVPGDIKGEYDPLCAWLGVAPIAVGPGLSARVNPLDKGPLGAGWDRLDAVETRRRSEVIFARWLQLIAGLVGSRRIGESHVPFTPSDERAVALALAELTGYARGNTLLAEATLPQLWHALDQPSTDLVSASRYPTAQAFLDATRLLRDCLGQLVTGSLAGLFDAPTNLPLDWAAPIQSLNLSRLREKGEDALGIALLCMNSWTRGIREITAEHDRMIIIRDETWYQMRLGIEAVKSLDGDLRLTRSMTGDINIIVMHKPSDPRSAGAHGSQAVTIAADMMHLASVKVLYGQDPAIADELATMLDLGPRVRHLVTGWAKAEPGRAVWMVGPLPFAVHTIRHPIEAPLTWTNDKLGGTP